MANKIKLLRTREATQKRMKKFKKYTDNYRKNLDNLCKFIGFNNADHFDEVKPFIPNRLKVLGPPDTREKQVNCHGYTFGTHRWYTPKEVFEHNVFNTPLTYGQNIKFYEKYF